MTPLPIDPFLPEITQSLRAQRNLVLVAEPGAGKTTRIPPAILRAGLLTQENPNLVMLQPRRVAARASAKRIAEENNWTLGHEVGYHVRFDRRLSNQTRLRVLTEGILTRKLLDDPFIESIGCVILDEFHERSIHTDIAIALLREIQQSVRPDLMLIVMSATLHAGPVSKFLGDCPIINVPGRTFPVEVKYSTPSAAPIEDRISSAIDEILITGSGVTGHGSNNENTRDPRPATRDPNDILVFLPGAEEIRRTHRALEKRGQTPFLILPLYGSLPAEQQDAALRPADQRKIILSTNIAETSLTIEGVRYVIDSGLARVPHYDAERGLDRLDLQRISKASAKQRAGRAGRTAPGVCIRLWTAKEDAALTDYDLPEIQRVDLAGIALSLHAWGKPDLRKFNWFEPPDEAAIVRAERLLEMLGALEPVGQTFLSVTGRGTPRPDIAPEISTASTPSSDWQECLSYRITPLGRSMSSLPLHPRLARLLIAAKDARLAREAATIAAMLSEKDILPPSREPTHVQADSDLLYRTELIHRHDRSIDPIALRSVHQVRDELLRYVEPSRNTGVPPVTAPSKSHNASSQVSNLKSQISNEDMLKLLLLAYPDRVARRRENDPSSAIGVGETGLRLSPQSVVKQGGFFLALDARRDDRSQKSEAIVRIASRIEESWLHELFPQHIHKSRELTYDPDRRRVIAKGLTKFLDLTLKEDRDAPVDPEKAGDILADALAPRARDLFESDDSALKILARIKLLRENMPEHPFPKFDDEELAQVLRDACTNKKSLDEIGSLSTALLSHLHYPLDRLLKEHAPESIEVPTGNRIRVEYSMTQSPVLAVRLQELFGMLDTPRLATGRVPVVLHLLSPGYKPVQITQDLRSFWTNTYPQVRKDLRARYPKHSWPENPFTAKPVAKGRPSK